MTLELDRKPQPRAHSDGDAPIYHSVEEYLRDQPATASVEPLSEEERARLAAKLKAHWVRARGSATNKITYEEIAADTRSEV